jgi:histone acetyltransferase 1
MIILLHLIPSDARAARAYRLQVKERLYRFNYVSRRFSTAVSVLIEWVLFQEILVQLDKRERLEKLEETFQSVREDYRRILAMIS